MRIVQCPAAESGQPAVGIADGDHQPPAEQVPLGAVIALPHHSRGGELRRLEALTQQVAAQGFAIEGSQSQLEGLGRGPVEAPGLHV